MASARAPELSHAWPTSAECSAEHAEFSAAPSHGGSDCIAQCYSCPAAAATGDGATAGCPAGCSAASAECAGSASAGAGSTSAGSAGAGSAGAKNGSSSQQKCASISACANRVRGIIAARNWQVQAMRMVLEVGWLFQRLILYALPRMSCFGVEGPTQAQGCSFQAGTAQAKSAGRSVKTDGLLSRFNVLHVCRHPDPLKLIDRAHATFSQTGHPHSKMVAMIFPVCTRHIRSFQR